MLGNVRILLVRGDFTEQLHVGDAPAKNTFIQYSSNMLLRKQNRHAGDAYVCATGVYVRRWQISSQRRFICGMYQSCARWDPRIAVYVGVLQLVFAAWPSRPTVNNYCY